MVDWDEHATGWDDDPSVRAYASSAFETLTNLLGARDISMKNLRVLDFGCGTGLLSAALASTCAEVVGLDPSLKMVSVLREKIRANGWTHVEAVHGTLEDLLGEGKERSGKIDLVVCSSVCAFLEDYPGAARKLVSLLSPGGTFIQFDWERDDAADEPFGLGRAEIETALGDAGLKTVSVEEAFECTLGDTVMRPLVGIGQRTAT